MIDMMPMLLSRATDGASMGRITRSRNRIVASIDDLGADSQDAPGPRRFSSLDAAVHWIESHSFLPDAGLCPHREGVFGPVFQAHDAFSIHGCVRLDQASCAKGIGSASIADGTTLVALDGHGEIQGTLRRIGAKWTLRFLVNNAITVQRCTSWATAVRRFHALAVQTLFSGSLHERLQVLSCQDDVLAQATAFLDDRARLDALFMPGTTHHQAFIHHTIMFQTPIVHSFGSFQGNLGAVEAMLNAQDRPYRERVFTSFDESYAWLVEGCRLPRKARTHKLLLETP